MMLAIFLLFASTEAHRRLAGGASFSYDFCVDDGPRNWGVSVPGSFCGSSNKQQSPINICAAVHDPSLNLGGEASYKYDGGLWVNNNGKTVTVGVDANDSPPMLINSLGKRVGRSMANSDSWQLEQLHFHWGRSQSEGSEHFLAGRQFPLEVHFVHFNTAYQNVGAAVGSGNQNGLLVVGVFFEVGDTEQQFLTSIANSIPNARQTSGAFTFGTDDFRLFAEATIIQDGIAFSTYAGSLTTPTCNEAVTWVVLDKPLKVTVASLAKFLAASDSPASRRLRASPPALISTFGNFRFLQPINGRTIYASAEDSIARSQCTEPSQPILATQCVTYAWVAQTPICPVGLFWDSGCGQAPTTETGNVVCMGVHRDGATSVAQSASSCSGTPPPAKVLACPGTPPCPRCAGCRRNGDCWRVCGNKAGPCSACDSNDGVQGFCCLAGSHDDGAECLVSRPQFFSGAGKIHTCALAPTADSHLTALFVGIINGLFESRDAILAIKAKLGIPINN